MLWHMELKFCIWLSFYILQIKFECHQFPTSFVGVSLSGHRILEIQSFAIYSHTCFGILLHALAYWVKMLNLTWLSRNDFRVKCKYYQIFSSIFVESYSSCGTFNTENTQFSHFSTRFDILIGLCFAVLHIKSDCRQFGSFFLSELCRFLNLYNRKYNFPFFLLHICHIELKLCIWLSFNEFRMKV